MPRQKSAPKRDAHAAVTVSSQPHREEDELSEGEYDVFSRPAAASSSATSTSTNTHTNKKAKISATSTTTTTSSSSTSSTSTKKKSAPAPSAMRYEDEDVTLDALGLATEYIVTAAGGGGQGSSTGQLGSSMHRQLQASARLDAADRGGNAVELQLMGKKGQGEGEGEGEGGKRQMLCVNFVFNKKPFQDKVPIYTTAEMAKVFAKVLQKQSTKRRKATASHQSVKLEEVAKRSPPFLWSLFYQCDADVEKGLAGVLQEAEAFMLEEEAD